MKNGEIRGIGKNCSTDPAQANWKQTATHSENAKVTSCAKFLAANLQKAPDANQRKRLFKIAEDPSSLTNEVDQALKIANTIPNDTRKSWALLDISKAFTQQKKFDEALEVANTIPDDTTKSWALQNISNAFTQLKKFGEALKIANKISNPAEKSWALLDISKAFTQQKKFDKALEIANNALEAANTIPDDTTKSWVLRKISEALKTANAMLDNTSKGPV